MIGMTQDAFGELLDKLYYGALDTRDRGDKFERLMRSYLLTDQAYSFSKVWLWNEYPDRGNRSDIGVDLVGVRADTGEKVAIQCKFKDPDKVIAKGDIDSFISASATAEFGERLMVSTSLKELGGNTRKTIDNLDKPWSTVGLAQLADAPIDWSQFNLDQPDHMVRTDEGKSPRPYQLQAMAAVKEGFESHDRGKLIMACGTGKTFTSLRLAEQQPDLAMGVVDIAGVHAVQEIDQREALVGGVMATIQEHGWPERTTPRIESRSASSRSSAFSRASW
mgnify:CR=1 FL=1